MSSEPERAHVVLIGFGPTTLASLNSLRRHFTVLTLVRDRDDEVAGHARRSGVPVELMSSPEEVAGLVEAVGPDLVVVSSYNRILADRVLALCPFINVHYAPLPEYRGRANVNWAMINHESHAAVTVHSMAVGVDAGEVLARATVAIRPRDTIATLYDRLNAAQAEILPGAALRRLRGDLGDPQDGTRATYCCARVPEDGDISWAATTRDIDALVRAVGPPYPGAFTFLGLERVFVTEAEPSPDPKVYVGRVPGRIVGWSAREGWTDVLTGDGVLRVRRVQVAGVNRAAATVLHGSRVTLGLRTVDLLLEIESLAARVKELSFRADATGSASAG